MSDLISRADLFNELATVKASPEANEYKAEVYTAIKSLPSAEPKTGKWVRRIVGTDYWHCSECGDYGLCTDFCPMCGARMLGEDGEE